MKIDLHTIPVRDLVQDYIDKNEEGVFGYGGRLNIRPPYQREFIYGENERSAVIDTVQKGFPLNVMYWVKNGENFEVLDGQQRTISLCQYVAQERFSVKNLSDRPQFFSGLPEDQQEKILNYELKVYFCEGTHSEKLDWFEIINIAGKQLTKQELRNVVYTGQWLADAKLKFSKTNCAAYGLGKEYVNGSPIRQDFLETAIDWISGDDKIEDYMSLHQHDQNANELWLYYHAVIHWVQAVFPHYHKSMKGIDWGRLYNICKDKKFDTGVLAERVKALLKDEEVTKNSGIYEYVLTGKERCLNLRAFSEATKESVYEQQNGICPHCKKSFAIEEMEGDHIKPWHEGGKTIIENCQMLCKDCNRHKAGK